MAKREELRTLPSGKKILLIADIKSENAKPNSKKEEIMSENAKPKLISAKTVMCPWYELETTYLSVAANRSTKVREILRNSMETYCQINPIIATSFNGKMYIIDGNNRRDNLVAAKVDGRIEILVFDRELTEREIVQLIIECNNSSIKWKPKDYVHCFSELKNESYIRFRQYQIRFPFVKSFEAMYEIAEGELFEKKFIPTLEKGLLVFTPTVEQTSLFEEINVIIELIEKGRKIFRNSANEAILPQCNNRFMCRIINEFLLTSGGKYSTENIRQMFSDKAHLLSADNRITDLIKYMREYESVV